MKSNQTRRILNPPDIYARDKVKSWGPMDWAIKADLSDRNKYKSVKVEFLSNYTKRF